MRKFFAILGYGLLASASLVVVGVLLSIILPTFTGDDRSENQPIKNNTSVSANDSQVPVSDLQPTGELAEAFNVFSSYTQLQREELEKRITGKNVSWKLNVYDVSRVDDMHYVIQSKSSETASVSCNIRNLSAAQAKELLALNEGDRFVCRGTIKRVFFRTIEIDPAEFSL
jgi:hypothetical protein